MYSGNEALVRYQLQCLKPAPQRLRIRDSPILPAFIHTCSTLFSVCHWNLSSRNSNKSFILTTIKKNCVWVCKLKGFLNDSVVKESACQCRRYKRCRFYLWVRKIPWRREWHPTQIFLPEESHGHRSLVGYNP